MCRTLHALRAEISLFAVDSSHRICYTAWAVLFFAVACCMCVLAVWRDACFFLLLRFHSLQFLAHSLQSFAQAPPSHMILATRRLFSVEGMEEAERCDRSSRVSCQLGGWKVARSPVARSP